MFPDSTIIHAVPTPIDLGGRGKALCGHSAATGWHENVYPADPFRCHSCLVEIEKLFSGERLAAEDRQEYIRIMEL